MPGGSLSPLKWQKKGLRSSLHSVLCVFIGIFMTKNAVLRFKMERRAWSSRTANVILFAELSTDSLFRVSGAAGFRQP